MVGVQATGLAAKMMNVVADWNGTISAFVIDAVGKFFSLASVYARIPVFVSIRPVANPTGRFVPTIRHGVFGCKAAGMVPVDKPNRLALELEQPVIGLPARRNLRNLTAAAPACARLDPGGLVGRVPGAVLVCGSG